MSFLRNICCLYCEQIFKRLNCDKCLPKLLINIKNYIKCILTRLGNLSLSRLARRL